MHLDYMTMKEREEGQEDSEKGSKEHDSGTPILAYVLKPAGWYGAHVVPHKGANMYAGKRLAQDLKWFGYPRVIWKSDQEPSILSLRDLVQQTLGASVTVDGNPVGLGFEGSAVGESRSNGGAENGVQQIQGQIRVIQFYSGSREY